MRFEMVAAMAALLAAPAWADPASPLPKGAAAGSTAAHSPLKPGKAAGVHQAQESRAGLLLLGAGGAVVAGVALAVSAGSGNDSQINPQMNAITTSATTS